jgi:N-acetylneuraminic acid mutarotase
VEVEVTNDKAPSCRLAHAQAVVGKNLYVFGGRQGVGINDNKNLPNPLSEKPLNDLWCFDWEAKTWTEIETQGEIPELRSFHQMVAGQGANSNKLYVFGGCAAKGRLNDLHEYDISS